MNAWPFSIPYDFWRRPIRPEPLALFRILLGVTYLAALLIGLAPDLNRYLELCPPETLDKWLGTTGRWSLFRAPAYFPERSAEDGPVIPKAFAERWNVWGADRNNVYAAYAVLVAAVFGMTVGFFTRFCTFIALLLTISFHNRILWTINGGDDMFRVALFYLTIAPAGAVWSLDRRRWLRRAKDAQAALEPVYIQPWSVRLIQIQLCAVYFFTGLAKVGQDWINGEALYWVMNDLALTRWPYFRLPVPMWMCRIASWSTLIWEIAFPFLVFLPWLLPRPLAIPALAFMQRMLERVRALTLLAGVALHVGIFLSMEVGWFSQVTLCWYVVFLNGDWLARQAARLSRPGGTEPEAATFVPSEQFSPRLTLEKREVATD